MVAERLAAVRLRIEAAETRAGRAPGSVRLVAISKGHSLEAITAAYDAGQRDFGENRAEEMMTKVPHLPDDIRWHFVGSLQRRKAKLVRSATWLLHSLDRGSLIREWAREGEPIPPTLLQVNLADEPQKHGASPEEAGDLIAAAADAGVPCRGLMIIPPVPDVPEASRPWFQELVSLRRSLAERFPDLAELSMGMTDDFEVAIEEGATVIRVGRAIFGPRNGGDRAGERGV
jgi:pyridoxal phosphate enzyme (YggS family)